MSGCHQFPLTELQDAKEGDDALCPHLTLEEEAKLEEESLTLACYFSHLKAAPSSRQEYWPSK